MEIHFQSKIESLLPTERFTGLDILTGLNLLMMDKDSGSSRFFTSAPLYLEQGCTTQISWKAPKFFLTRPVAKVICFNTFKGCFYHRNKQSKENLGFRWPYVVHA